MMKNKQLALLYIAIISLFFAPVMAMAQEKEAVSEVSGAVVSSLYDSLNYQDELGQLSMMPEDVRELSTLFFTKWQHALLQEARAGYETRPLDPGEASSGAPIVKGPREISLGGIVFKSSEQWTVWLNGRRITPDAIPREVLDLRVANDYIELKWFDAFTNQIFPIRLRAHQRFNIDSRIFLPGAGVN